MKEAWSGERLEPYIFNEATIEHLHRYALAIPIVKNKRVLDIACGEGYGANFLAQEASTVIGVDLHQPTIQNAITHYKKPNLSFKVGSALLIPEEDHCIDVVVSFETLEHISQQQAMLHEVKRVLKDAGILIISTPDKKRYTDETGYHNPYHVKELYEAEFKDLLSHNFKNCIFLQQSFIQGSLIISEKQGTGFSTYSGDFSRICSNLFPQPRFWIAIASDGELPNLTESFFYNEWISRMIIKSEQAAIKATLTYRIGHFLLFPFKALRTLLQQ